MDEHAHKSLLSLFNAQPSESLNGSRLRQADNARLRLSCAVPCRERPMSDQPSDHLPISDADVDSARRRFMQSTLLVIGANQLPAQAS